MAFASATICSSNFGTFQSILPAADHHKTTFIPTPNFATPANRSINGGVIGPLTADSSPPPDLLFNSSPPTLIHDYDHHHHHHYRGNLGAAVAAFDEYPLKRHQYLNSELEEEEDLNLYGGGFLPPFPPSLAGNLLDDESYGVFPSSLPSLQLPMAEPPFGGLPINIMLQEEELGDSMYKMIPPPLTALYNTEHIWGEGNDGGHGSTDRSECGGGNKVVMLQSIAARERRRKIKEKTQELGKLIPGGTKLNTADMFLAASKYVEFLQAQLGILHFVATHSIPRQGDEMKEGNINKKGEGEGEGEGQLTGEQVRLAGMLESPAVQEKLFARKKCLILKSSVNLLTTHHRHFFPSDPSITSDLIRLISPSDGPECPNLYFPA